MTLSELYNILKTVPGYTTKVAYRAFPIGAAPNLPFIVYREAYTHNFSASNRVCVPIRHIVIELYTNTKAPTEETKLETVLDGNDIFWDKTETYIDAERCYQILYEIEI